MNTSKPRRLPRRINRTRAALIDAGRRLLVENSIDAIAIGEIVNAAGVAKGSFYNHFSDRESFVHAIRESIREEIETLVEKLNEGISDPASRVARAMAIYVDYMVADRQRAIVLFRLVSGLASAQNPLNQGVLRDVTDGLLGGRFIVPSADVGALFVLGASIIALMRVVEEPNRSSAAVLAQQLSGLLLRGLGLTTHESEAISAAAVHQIIVAPGKSANLVMV